MSDCPECPGTDHPSHRQRHEKLPATLSTVADVAAVCAAAGLGQFSERSIVWRHGDVVVVISTDPRGRLVVVDVRAAERNICRVWHDAPSAVLTAAIEAARTAGGEQT